MTDEADPDPVIARPHRGVGGLAATASEEVNVAQEKSEETKTSPGPSETKTASGGDQTKQSGSKQSGSKTTETTTTASTSDVHPHVEVAFVDAAKRAGKPVDVAGLVEKGPKRLEHDVYEVVFPQRSAKPSYRLVERQGGVLTESRARRLAERGRRRVENRKARFAG